MKKILTSLLVFAALFLLPACSEKFNVAAPYKNITIIYGLLDKRDTAHYIRIQKAFLDQNKSAITMAKVADSSFFQNLNVTMKQINMNDGSVWSTISLNRVDLNLEGYPKEPGTFFDAPNYAYKFKDALDPDFIYRIVVFNPSTGETDSADAPIIDDVNNTVFNVPVLGDDTSLNLQGLDFESTNAFRYFDIYGSYIPNTSFNYNGAITPVGILQGFIRFNWEDSSMTTHVTSRHYYDYDLGYSGLTHGALEYQVKNLALYNAVNQALGRPSDSFTVRLLDRCDLFIYAGTTDFNTYISVAAIQGTGLTGNEVKPSYTNIKGKNVLGLFTSRGYRNGRITITNNTILALESDPVTSVCRIAGTTY